LFTHAAGTRVNHPLKHYDRWCRRYKDRESNPFLKEPKPHGKKELYSQLYVKNLTTEILNVRLKKLIVEIEYHWKLLDRSDLNWVFLWRTDRVEQFSYLLQGDWNHQLAIIIIPTKDIRGLMEKAQREKRKSSRLMHRPPSEKFKV
jgi:hypothetical protein